MPSEVNRILMRLRRRAERQPPDDLRTTFVEPGPLYAMLSNEDHQVLYGRRGTGKTHALRYLAEAVRSDGNTAVLIDMRTLGSNGGLYNRTGIPIAERGTRLLVDVLTNIHRELYDRCFAGDGDHQISDSTLSKVEEFAAAITEVQVVGAVEAEVARAEMTAQEDTDQLGIHAGPVAPAVRAERRKTEFATEAAGTRVIRRGTEQHRVVFGSTGNTLEKIIDGLGGRLWIMLDEWSELPRDLQPLVADLIRRCLLPIGPMTVKIAAIQDRCSFRCQTPEGGYLGFEVGADIAPDVNFDDYLVFGNDADQSREFFAELLYRHAVATAETGTAPGSLDDRESFMGAAFTHQTSLDELVRAAEGVPRDAMNVALLAAQRAGDSRISVDTIRRAARDWYERDKGEAVRANEALRALLEWIVEVVISGRRARAFLLEQGAGERHDLVRALYDARILHIIKRGVSGQDHPGRRFDVYAIDYGCYVDLMRSGGRPRGLFEAASGGSEEEFVAVPQDDYRSIRRAVLDLDAFEEDQA